jgi:hypothetical protein
MSDEDYELGAIVITYRLEADAPVISVTLPGVEDIPMVVQLGMLDYARLTMFGVMRGDIES